MTGQNIVDQVFDTLDEDIVACNVTNCTFNNVENIKFERSNVKNCIFKTITSFDRCNVIACELVDGSTYDKTNVMDEEPSFDLPDEDEDL